MYYSKASNTILYNPATQRAQGGTSGAAGPEALHQGEAESDIKGPWKKRILIWFFKEEANVAWYKGLGALHRRCEEHGWNERNLCTSVMTTEMADSSESELQPTSHEGTNTLHGDGHKTRSPGLPARQDSLF